MPVMNKDTERKLALTRLIREENRSNELKLRTREQILYGKSTSYSDYDEYGGEPYTSSMFHGSALTAAEYERDGETRPMSSLGLRFIIAAILFGIYFFMHAQGLSFGSVTAQTIENAISTEQSTKLVDFIRNFTYTLPDDGVF